MWTQLLRALLTSLRYLAPATLLTIFWGHDSFLFKVLRQIDAAFRSIIYSSDEQSALVLRWVSDSSPVRVRSLEQVWRHGWLACGLLEQALPGACGGHPRSELSIEHAQSLAEQYLGVQPVFSREELESKEALTKCQEWKLAHYLDQVRLSLGRLSPPVSKPNTPRVVQEVQAYTLDYVARGMGLCAAQTHGKTCFKIYPTAQQCLEPGEINVLIRGPGDIFGTAVIPPVYGRAQLLRQAFLGLNVKSQYTQGSLPLTQGTAYLRSYGKNDMNKTFHIPKIKQDIDIEVSIRRDHTRVIYSVTVDGIYEISLTSRGYNLIGSPFRVSASEDSMECDTSTELDDDEECGIVDFKSERRVIYRVVDFVTEKMLLTENGSLEKITDEEAKQLLSNANAVCETDIDDEPNKLLKQFNLIEEDVSKRLKTTVRKIMKMIKVCNSFKATIKNMGNGGCQLKRNFKSHSDIPDIVHSMIFDKTVPIFGKPLEKDEIQNIERNQQTEITIPCHNISEEKSYSEDSNEMLINNIDRINDNEYEENYYSHLNERPIHTSQERIEHLDSPQNTKISEKINYYSLADNYNAPRSTSSSGNPFLCDIPEVHEKAIEIANIKAVDNSTTFNPFHDNNIDKDVIISTLDDNLIQILIDTDSEEVQATNPLIHEDIMERPKTPILKIITGELGERDDSVYFDSRFKLPDEFTSDDELHQSNEFLNPFFVHKIYQNSMESTSLKPPLVTDFLIGAPVSLPPFLKAPSPEPDMESIILAPNLEESLHKYDNKVQNMQPIESVNSNESLFSTPVPPTPTHRYGKTVVPEEMFSEVDSTYYSTECYTTESGELSECTNQSIKVPHKDLWDSAYVSIDETNSSPDSNNNSETPNKIKALDGEKPDLANERHNISIGPAEREIWQTCAYVNADHIQLNEGNIFSTIENNRSMFPTILEENEKRVPSALGYSVEPESMTQTTDTNSITVALAELNDIYREYITNSDSSLLSLAPEKEKFQSIEVNFAIPNRGNDVNSASECESDVKRHCKNEEAAAISEVQSHAIEFFSASRALEDSTDLSKDAPVRNDVTMFGDKPSSNIVNERKKYWDEKIKAIEEIKAQQQKKRKITSKHLKLNDSLSKRKGKNIAKNLVNMTESLPSFQKAINNQQHTDPSNKPQNEIKLVDKWKKFWDEKLVTTEEIISYSPKKINQIQMSQNSESKPLRITTENKLNLLQNESGEKPEETLPEPEIHSPIKLDITDEKVFKAFETSPKRFFGNSRKNILDKIDSFLGSAAVVEKETVDVTGTRRNLGIVSNRISMFNIDKADDDNVHKYKDILGTNKQKEPSISEIYPNIKTANHNKSKPATELNDHKTATNHNTDDTKVFTEKPATELNEQKTTANENNDDTKVFTRKPANEHNNQKTNTEKNEPTISKETTKVKSKIEKFRKLSTSKSEMDIFNRTETKSDSFDIHKSCEDLYKVNVRNVISQFENATKIDCGVQKNVEVNKVSSMANTPSPLKDLSFQSRNKDDCTVLTRQHLNDLMSEKRESANDNNGIEKPNQHSSHKTENNATVDSHEGYDKNVEKNKSPDKQPEAIEYKKRFKMAKQFFQSLEELRNDDADKVQKLNECEMILYNQPTETPRPASKTKKKVHAHSAPTSDCEYESNAGSDHLEGYRTGAGGRRLIKISEKFQVEDLFRDVAGDGKLSRQGSFRGIPHKHAVLATFKSMENVTDTHMTSYEMSESQLTEFAKENGIRNAQTYLTEYPYLPQTEPSKYRSRLDNSASGLISRKELLKHMRPRRNSVPDALRLNERFTASM